MIVVGELKKLGFVFWGKNEKIIVRVLEKNDKTDKKRAGLTLGYNQPVVDMRINVFSKKGNESLIG